MVVLRVYLGFRDATNYGAILIGTLVPSDYIITTTALTIIRLQLCTVLNIANTLMDVT
jgi:hypothetical protein